MKKLYLKQAVFTLSERFTIIDEQQTIHYTAEGSFFKIPKNFTVKNHNGQVITTITKEIFSLLPRFTVNYGGQEAITLRKELSFFKSHYSISANGIEVKGDWWDMSFDVFQNNLPVAHISKHWFTWGDTYEIAISEPGLEELIISLVIAIDCVKADEASASGTN